MKKNSANHAWYRYITQSDTNTDTIYVLFKNAQNNFDISGDKL